MRLSVAVFVVSSAAAAFAQEFPSELVRFAAYEGNPVFTAGGEGRWDAKIRERGWILVEDGVWKLWFTGYDGTRAGKKMLGYATSTDGVRWTRHPKNPVYSERWVEDVTVVRDGETLYMFAEGEGDRAQLLTSADGVEWNWRGFLDVRRADGRPLTPGPYGTPTVWKEDGVWRLFYERRDAGVWLAASRDMEVWINESDEPVLRPGPDSYDGLLIAMNQIVKRGGVYYAYYHGRGPDSPNWCSCIAASEDLLRWRKFAGNPLLPRRENKSSPVLVDDGRRYRLYTMHDKVDLHLPSDSFGER
jgi:hypothetical protein